MSAIIRNGVIKRTHTMKGNNTNTNANGEDEGNTPLGIRPRRNLKATLEYTQAKQLSQFLTLPKVARYCFDLLQKVYPHNMNQFIYLEPSAGAGAFYDLCPAKQRIGVEIDPKFCDKHHPYLLPRDGFLSLNSADLGLTKISRNKIIALGNPPYNVATNAGRSVNLALKFVNHCAEFAHVLMFILPTTFRRPHTFDKVDRRYHLLCDHDIDDNSFELDGEPAKIKSTCMIFGPKYDLLTNKLMERPKDKRLDLLRIWKENVDAPWKFVACTDPIGNLRIVKWGSANTIGTIEGPEKVKERIAFNQLRTYEQRNNKKFSGADKSGFTICAISPRRVQAEFERRKPLFLKMARDRSTGHNPDLTATDIVQIYITPY